MADDFRLHLAVGTGRDRDVSVYAEGTAVRRAARAKAVSTGLATFDRAGAENLIDAMCAATGYRPEPQARDLDAQRRRIRLLGDELRALRAGDDTLAELAELALTRHVGDIVALAADLLYSCRSNVAADRTVAELLSELVLMADAMHMGTALTNAEARVEAHYARTQQLRKELPTSGEDPNA